MTVLLEHFALQLLFTVGIIVVTGLTVAGAKRLFLKCCGRGAYCAELVTGLVGTPIHELSHAFFCLLFGHRITGIRLWSPSAEGGNLGYVTHTYRKRNLWHQLGNFFIGVAPIIGGSGVLFLLLWLLLPNTSSAVFQAAYLVAPEAVSDVPATLLRQALDVLAALFSPENFLRWHWYLYLLLAVLVVLHMEISGSDLRSGLWGFCFLAAGLLIADLILLLAYPEGLYAVTSVAVSIGAFLASFLCIAICIAAILLVISLIVLIVRRR